MKLYTLIAVSMIAGACAGRGENTLGLTLCVVAAVLAANIEKELKK